MSMTTPKENYSFSHGLKVAWLGLKFMAIRKPLIFAWVNLFGTWFVGGAGLMLYWGSTSILPIVCLITPLVTLPWFVLIASKFGFSRITGMPRALPWLVAMWIAVAEYLDGSYLSQPEGYTTFLVGFIIINGICTLIDFIDIYRWLSGDRDEHPDTGFFQGAY